MKNGKDDTLSAVKLIIFTLLFTTIFFSVTEFCLRLLKEVPKTDYRYSLDSENIGLDMEDEQLFWRMKPNVNIEWQGVNIKTNSLGFRDNAVSGTKKENVLRILSLGESTAFGAKVEFEKIYSEILEKRLNSEQSNHTFEVINAGVSAYTSFQSLIYLKKYGLKLNPDIILIYHWANDNLPTSIRRNRSAFDLTLTDRQIYGLRNSFCGFLYYLNKSEIYKLIKNYVIRARIVLLDKSIKTMIKEGTPAYNSLDIGRKCRVPLEDKKWVFKEFLKVSKENNISLVIIHPTYKATTMDKNDFLTEFSTQNNIPLVETFDSFQNSGYLKDELFYDNMHPTALGHRIIADCILEYIKLQYFPKPEVRKTI